MLPSREEWRRSWGPWGRGSLIGFFFGLLPGPSAALSSFASYQVEKKVAKGRAEMGKGAIEGVAGPEAANNAAATSGMIPVLSLGLPFSATLALILAALMIHGIQPGPLLPTQHPDIFWGVIASMFIGNLMLLALNIPLVGVFVQLLRVRAGILAAFALLITMAGVFSVNNDPFDMWVVLVFGILGWLMKKTGFEPGPLVLAFVLGSILERAFRQSMLLSGGSFDIFVTRPLSGSIFALMLAVVLYSTWAGIRRRRQRGGVPYLSEKLLEEEVTPDGERLPAEEGTAGVAATDGPDPRSDGPRPPSGGDRH
jgi:putative tricarboxylic transport membrane protein